MHYTTKQDNKLWKIVNTLANGTKQQSASSYISQESADCTAQITYGMTPAPGYEPKWLAPSLQQRK